MVQTRQEADRIGFAYTTVIVAAVAAPLSAGTVLSMTQAVLLGLVVLSITGFGMYSVYKRGAAYQNLWDSLLKMENAFAFYTPGAYYDEQETVLPAKWWEKRTRAPDRWQHVPHMWLLPLIATLACILIFGLIGIEEHAAISLDANSVTNAQDAN